MAILDEVRSMISQGMSDDQVIQTMRQRGVKYKDIADALAQTKIQSAVEQPVSDPSYEQGTQMGDMQASIMNQQVPSPGQPTQEQYAPQPLPQGQTSEFNPYQQEQSYSPPALSSEVITEISEQVVAEKLSDVRKHLEKAIDLKTMMEAKMESLDERLKRIEKTIDALQTSVLRKVGDYVTNVQDLKNELIETQKTFSKAVKHKEHK